MTSTKKIMKSKLNSPKVEIMHEPDAEEDIDLLTQKMQTKVRPAKELPETPPTQMLSQRQVNNLL